MSKTYTHRYDNGLVLVAEPIDSLESAAFAFLVPAGCVYEPGDRAGLAGFSCEMALRGAGDRDSRQFVNDLDNLGVERSESVSSAHTAYGGATLARHLPQALSIYADVLRRPLLPGEQLEAGRQVVMHELIAVEDDPAQKVMVELRQRHYGLPWGRSSLGQRSSLETIGLDEITQFHARHYQPDGTILAVAGKIDFSALKADVGRLFHDWEPHASPLPDHRKPQAMRDHLAHEANQTQIGISYESVPYRHPDFYQAWGAVGVLSGGMSSRLFDEVREKRGLCYAVYASHHTLRDRAAVLCYAGTTAGRAQETLDVTLGELIRLGDGIETHEIERLKARIKSALVMQQESSSSRASSIARDWFHLGRVRSLDEISAAVDGLSAESINAFLREHPPQDFSVVTLGPEPLEVPVGVS